MIIKDITYGKILENSFYTISTLDGQILETSKSFAKSLKMNTSDIVGLNIKTLHFSIYSTEYYLDLEKDIIEENLVDRIIKYKTSQNEPKYFNITNIPIEENGKITKYITTRKEVTDLITTKRYCNLTKLENREALVEYLKHNCNQNDNILIAIINTDDFSTINDIFGGANGNDLIVEISNRMRIFNHSYNIYKLRDDEFAVINNFDNKKYTKDNEDEMIEKIKFMLSSIFNKEFIIDNSSVIMRATTGITIAKPDVAFKEANTAMLFGKKQNETFLRYEPFMLGTTEKIKSLEMFGTLKEAIDTKNIVTYYQPIINNDDRSIYKYEALVRLKTQSGSILPPHQKNISFLELSKQTKLYGKLTEAVLKNVAKDFAHIDQHCSVNITMDDILNVRTNFVIFDFLYNFPEPHRITFEIVETDEIKDYKVFNKFYEAVKKVGAKIALDDFGSGFSNFEYLSKIRFDYLKIDGQFIKDIDTNSKNKDIVKLIVSYSKLHDIKVIAEYVENETIFNILKDIGVDYSQGFYFGEPYSSIEL